MCLLVYIHSLFIIPDILWHEKLLGILTCTVHYHTSWIFGKKILLYWFLSHWFAWCFIVRNEPNVAPWSNCNHWKWSTIVVKMYRYTPSSICLSLCYYIQSWDIQSKKKNHIQSKENFTVLIWTITKNQNQHTSF